MAIKSRIFIREIVFLIFVFQKKGSGLVKVMMEFIFLAGKAVLKKLLLRFFITRRSPISTRLMIYYLQAVTMANLYSIRQFDEVMQIAINNNYFIKKIVKVDKEIWIATDGYGIIILDKNLHFSRILSRSNNTKLLSTAIVFMIFYPEKTMKSGLLPRVPV